MRRAFQLILLLPLALALGACWPRADNPIAAGANEDKSIEGAWVGRLGFDTGDDIADTPYNSPAYVTITRTGPGEYQARVLRAVDGEQTFAKFRVLRSEIGGTGFLSAALLDLSNAPVDGNLNGYALLRYEIVEGRLRLYLMDSTVAADAIASGELQGSVAGSPYFPDIRITSSTEEITAFVADGDPSTLFEFDAGDLERTRLP